MADHDEFIDYSHRFHHPFMFKQQVHPMNRTAKVTISCSVTWLVLTLAYFAFYFDDLFSILTPLAGGALLLACIPLAITAVLVGIKGKNSHLLGAAVLVVAVATVCWLTPFGKTFGAHFKFWRNNEHYQSVVDQVSNGADGSTIPYPVVIDPGPPQRVAFSWGGILDNWRGIVHDPSGEVMKANILDRTTWSNRDDIAYASVSGLFGGTLIKAQHLTGDWYLCWFT